MHSSPSAAFTCPTICGLLAILLWGLLALLTDLTTGVPPFLLTALTFGIAGGAGIAYLATAGKLSLLWQPPAAWVLGVGGLFFYHAVYFAALKAAPAAEASLIAYLWPLLIVLFSGLLPGESLSARHIIGAMLGFAGVAVLAISKGGLGQTTTLPLLGYSLALACAFIWSIYSVLSRRMTAVPTEAVVGFCLATALLALISHLALEPRGLPSGGATWAAIVALGLGPVGAAFFLWDIGMKRGNIRFLGVAAYGAPVISTFALIGAGRAEASLALLGAGALIVGGALVAGK